MLDLVLSKRWLKGVLAFAVWTLIGVAFAGQLYLTQSKLGNPVTWRFALGSALTDWYLFAVFSVPAVWLCHRARFERTHWQRSLVAHLVASAAFSVAWVAARVLAEQAQRWASVPAVTFADTFLATLVKTFYFNLLIYWVIVTVSHTLEYYRRYKDREVRAAELERRLAEARLQALQMQLNPHFLFNTLHAISSLMRKNVDAADRMIARLSDLLRYALESTTAQEVPLRQELDFLRGYLEIEQTRFGARLAVTLDVAPETLEAQVPNLVLQPLVENAIRHGIAPLARPGRIELRARNDNGRLTLEVSDNGRGLAGQQTPAEGVGLSNTRARLEQLYGDRQRIEFQQPPGGGLCVRVTIPFRPADPTVSSSAAGVPRSKSGEPKTRNPEP
jgi:signal transduction histidine kinase